MHTKMEIRHPHDAFRDAIATGTLSADSGAANYAGNYMYMYTSPLGEDMYKHILTREYLHTTPTAV